jgi:hypothetical protein
MQLISAKNTAGAVKVSITGLTVKAVKILAKAPFIEVEGKVDDVGSLFSMNGSSFAAVTESAAGKQPLIKLSSIPPALIDTVTVATSYGMVLLSTGVHVAIKASTING